MGVDREQNPRRYDKFPKSMMTETEREDLLFLESLPRKLPARQLVALLNSSTVLADMCGKIFVLSLQVFKSFGFCY